MFRVHLNRRDRRLILAWFAKIFGLRTPKPLLMDPELPKLTVFTIAQDQKWKNFLAPGNLFDVDRAIKVSLRIRPPNDGELAMKEKKERSY